MRREPGACLDARSLWLALSSELPAVTFLESLVPFLVGRLRAYVARRVGEMECRLAWLRWAAALANHRRVRFCVPSRAVFSLDAAAAP